jgi:hypothetical protein
VEIRTKVQLATPEVQSSPRGAVSHPEVQSVTLEVQSVTSGVRLVTLEVQLAWRLQMAPAGRVPVRRALRGWRGLVPVPQWDRMYR